MRQTFTRKVLCPGCGYQLDVASSVEGNNVPNEGDFSVCFGCGQILVFDADLIQRKATPEDMEAIDDHTIHVLATVQHAVVNKPKEIQDIIDKRDKVQ